VLEIRQCSVAGYVVRKGASPLKRPVGGLPPSGTPVALKDNVRNVGGACRRIAAAPFTAALSPPRGPLPPLASPAIPPSLPDNHVRRFGDRRNGIADLDFEVVDPLVTDTTFPVRTLRALSFIVDLSVYKSTFGGWTIRASPPRRQFVASTHGDRPT